MLKRRNFVLGGLAGAFVGAFAALRAGLSVGSVVPTVLLHYDLDGRRAYRVERALGAIPIRWEEQRFGDEILVIDWEHGRIKNIEAHRVVGPVAVDDRPKMPVRCQYISLERFDGRRGFALGTLTDG